MPFSSETLDFLFQNRVTDSKIWFNANRSEYDRLALEPMRKLVEDIRPYMLEIDPFLICEPKVGKSISRIFRDTRFSHDKHIFRDVMWCVFYRDKKLFHGMPGFYFELSPRCWRWGVGYYQATPEAMEAARDLIKAGDKSFIKAKKAYEKQSLFVLQDTAYKRTRNPDQPKELQFWLDQRNLCFTAESTDTEYLFADDLAKRLAADFATMKPEYDFMLKAESRVIRG